MSELEKAKLEGKKELLLHLLSIVQAEGMPLMDHLLREMLQNVRIRLGEKT